MVADRLTLQLAPLSMVHAVSASCFSPIIWEEAIAPIGVNL